MKPGYLYAISDIPSFKCPCPTCKVGSLIPDINSIADRQTGASISLCKEDESDESSVIKLLRIDLNCSNQQCEEFGFLIMKGNGYAPDEYSQHPEILYKPIYINPPLQLIKFQEKYPENVKYTLNEAFLLYWIDAASCGNKIRISIEYLLDHFDVEKYKKDKSGDYILTEKGRNKPLTLQNRLDEFKKINKKFSECADALESIKWLDNESSHASENIIFEDLVYKAMLIISAVLDYCFYDIPLSINSSYNTQHINFWYHPQKQPEHPRKT
nr:DUF4145 domain-containing protein [uncultured Tolumonas sp.]